nr:NAD(P)H-dependent oxidoreductase [uncultured Methanoregula sp.]
MESIAYPVMVDTMEFGTIVMSRYATKKFDGRKIPQEKVDELLEMVRYAPSALNLQPWKIKVVVDQKTKELLKPAAFNQEQVTSCSHLLVFCADPDYDSLIGRLDALLKKNGAPEEMQKAVIGMAVQFTKPMSPDQKLAWSQAQTYLALGNALNGAKALGFDSCPMGGFDPGEFSRILKIPRPLVPVMFCPLGYAADKPMLKVRFAKEDIIF